MPTLIVPIGVAGSGKSTAASVIRHLAMERGLKAREAAFAAPIKQFCRVVFEFTQEAVYGPSEAREQEMVAYFDLHAWARARRKLALAGDEFVDSCWPQATPDFWLQARKALDFWFDDLMAESPWEWVMTDGGRRMRRDTGLSARRVLQTLGTEWGRALDPDVWINSLKRSVASSHEDIVVLSDARFFNEAEKSGGFPLLIRRPNANTRTPTHASERDQQTPEMLQFCLDNGAVVDNTGSLLDLHQVLGQALDKALSVVG